MKGYKHTPEARTKISIAAKRRQTYVRTREIRAKASMTAIKRWENPEARKKMSEISKKVNVRPGMRERQGELRKKYYEIPGMREKQSTALKNSMAFQVAIRSPEHKKNLREAMKKRWANPEERKKTSDGIRNSPIFQTVIHSSEYRENHSGPNSSAWRGGIHTPYGLEFTADLKKMIRKRDDHLCQNPECYLPENGRLHAVHHIDYHQRNSNPPNLITLCIKCHTKTTIGDRHYWMDFYQALQEMRGIA